MNIKIRSYRKDVIKLQRDARNVNTGYGVQSDFKYTVHGAENEQSVSTATKVLLYNEA